MRSILYGLEKWSHTKFYIDYITFIILLLLFSNSTFFNLSINKLILVSLLYVPLFIFNYLLDKYKIFYSKKEFHKNLFIKSSIGFLCSFLFINLFFNLNTSELIQSIESNFNFGKFHFCLFLVSNLIQILTEYLTQQLTTSQEKWLVIGTKDIQDYIDTIIPRYIKLEYLDNLDKSNIDYKKLKPYEGFIFDDSSERSNEILNYLSSIKAKNIFSFSQWFEKYLKCIPSEFIPEKEISSRFLNYQNKKFDLRLKRLGDIVMSLLLLIITLPVIACMAILIKLEDGGPIFYIQKRTGLNFSTFKIVKLRSMRIDAENGKAQWANKDDPRITTIGKFIRKTRIDEVPQLWSVLKGEMSLIGPRPERPEFIKILEKEISNYGIRCRIKPGLSGWAQVNYPYGSSINDAKMKLSYDTFYMNNFSFYLDLIIMLKTIKIIILHKGT